ncbi:MAG: MoaD/ThiS family protein [Pseudomonadota bacterium]
MAITILYLAWVRDRVGITEEVIEMLPSGVDTPTALARWLSQRGDGYASAFKDTERLRCAVDLQMTAMDAPLGRPREIAFFPPVTGG